MILNAILFWLGAGVDSYSSVNSLEQGKSRRGFVRKLIDKLPFSTEVELLLLKGALFGGMFYFDAEWWHYLIGGGVQALAGIGNTQEWWLRLLELLQQLLDHWRNRPPG